MKEFIVFALAAGLAAFPLCGAMASSLPLKRVVLSTSGLAQFTHSGEAAAGSTLDLTVRLDQVDDLLKSLTIFDREGAIGPVSLQGKAPLAELFRDLPFGPEALQSQAALLNALVGAEIEIEGHVSAKGKVFRVGEEYTQLPNNGGQITRHRLTILTEDRGFVQAVLEELSSLRFTEPQTKAQIERALTGLAQNRAKERRALSITLAGQNTREVGFTYVVANGLPSGPAGWRRQGAAARLGHHREPDRQRLDGYRAVADFRQPGGAAPAVVYGVLRGSSGGPSCGCAKSCAAQGRCG
jgi:hypothetical protein